MLYCYCGLKIPVDFKNPETPGDSGKDCSNRSSPPGSNPVPRRTTDLLLVLAGTLLVFFGAAHTALVVAGKPETANITFCRQVSIVGNRDSSRNSNRYELEYAFAVNGQQYTGSATKILPVGSHLQQTVTVLYLPFWPRFNAEKTGVGLTGPAGLAVGLLIVAVGVRSITHVGSN